MIDRSYLDTYRPTGKEGIREERERKGAEGGVQPVPGKRRREASRGQPSARRRAQRSTGTSPPIHLRQPFLPSHLDSAGAMTCVRPEKPRGGADRTGSRQAAGRRITPRGGGPQAVGGRANNLGTSWVTVDGGSKRRPALGAETWEALGEQQTGWELLAKGEDVVEQPRGLPSPYSSSPFYWTVVRPTPADDPTMCCQPPRWHSRHGQRAIAWRPKGKWETGRGGEG